MDSAISFLASLSKNIYEGLDTIRFPILNVSFLVVLFSVFFLKLAIWFISVLTGGKQNSSDSSGSQKFDNNNNYIYRR